MAKLVPSVDECLKNVVKFSKAVDKSVDLQDRLSYNRAWYAHRDEKGKWWFGPSKFIGYNDMTAEEYIDTALQLNGRQTEAQLSRWFVTLHEGDDLYQELLAQLTEFLGKYNKLPSTKMRINVTKEVADQQGGWDETDCLVELIVAVSKKMTDRQRAELRQRLAA